MDTFLTEIDGLADYRYDPRCDRANYPTDPWSLVVTYPRAASIAVGSPGRICTSVEINGKEVDSQTVLTAYADAVRTQQAEREGTPQPMCSLNDFPRNQPLIIEADTWTGPLADFDPVAGRICYAEDRPYASSYYRAEGGLSTEQIDFLYRQLLRRQVPGTGSTRICADYGPNRTLILLDAQGNRISLIDDHCAGEFVGATAGAWSPGSRAENVLTQALGGRIPESG